MNYRAYQLWPEATHLVDMAYDVSALPIAARPLFASMAPLDIVEPLLFEANFGALRGRDLPVSAPATWPIMSRRMLDVLLSVAPFEHRAIRCVMIDDTVPSNDRRDASGNLRREIVDERFIAVQLTKHVDAFDWERSVYERDERSPSSVADVSSLVLRDDVELPPLFRLSAYPQRLFVSAEARTALEAAGLSGLTFRTYNFGME
jgi:hypothetical protein